MPPKTLYGFQEEAVLAVAEAFNAGKKRALIVMATGLGKTVIAAHYVSMFWLPEHPGKRVLFVAHTVDIIRQARKEFVEILGDAIETGIVNSDENENPNAQVLFTTFQTMHARLHEIDPSEFSLIVDDEAHHAWAVTYRPVIEHFKDAYALAMTATPERMDGQDIRDIFGDPVYQFDLVEGILRGHLAHVTYRVLFDNINIKQLRAYLHAVMGGDRSVSRRQINDTLFIEPREEEISRIIREARVGGEKTIHFCNSIEHVEKISEFHPDAKPYHSRLPSAVVQATLAAFRTGELREILVVDKFNEGVDIPDAEILVFRRATDSMNIWLQQLGRGTRKTTAKTHVQIYDFVANCDRVLHVAELGRKLGRGFAGQFAKPTSAVLEELNFQIEFSQEFRDLALLLERLDADFYPTLAEAKAAVQKLVPVPRSGLNYRLIYKQDPRLPANPNTFYPDWVDWYDFLDTRKYATYSEAREAVQRLVPVPRSGPEYRRIFNQDPHLPANPEAFYPDWVDWCDFLGKPNKQVKKYLTYAEARSAVQRLVPIPTSREEYAKIYGQDPRLPGNPNTFYPDWVDWYDFLGKVTYLTYAEAKSAVRRLIPVPASRAEYHKVYAQDSRLRANPKAFYPDWVDWYDFLGKPRRRKKKS